MTRSVGPAGSRRDSKIPVLGWGFYLFSGSRHQEARFRDCQVKSSEDSARTDDCGRRQIQLRSQDKQRKERFGKLIEQRYPATARLPEAPLQERGAQVAGEGQRGEDRPEESSTWQRRADCSACNHAANEPAPGLVRSEHRLPVGQTDIAIDRRGVPLAEKPREDHGRAVGTISSASAERSTNERSSDTARASYQERGGKLARMSRTAGGICSAARATSCSVMRFVAAPCHTGCRVRPSKISIASVPSLYVVTSTSRA